MPDPIKRYPNSYTIDSNNFPLFFNELGKRGFLIIGPTLRDNAIILDELNSVEELPIGWTDEQEGGMYRIKKRNDNSYFGYNLGPHSWKNFLFPPVTQLWQSQKKFKGYLFEESQNQPQKYAFLGVRACELSAITILDRIFFSGKYIESNYQSTRDKVFIIVVNCSQAGGTCFCNSMKTGPKAKGNFDLALTEIFDSQKHYFLAEVGSVRGEDLLQNIPHHTAKSDEISLEDKIIQKTIQNMGRTLDTHKIQELLYGNYENPEWENVAKRCLSCANCTMVCPTCFCHTVEDYTDLTGNIAGRKRKWDSCFTMDFSYIHGGSIRSSVMSRYRQWMTHKLATWIDQFGSSGCVGCGRCITWCPVGIDITEETRKIRESKINVKTI